MVIDRMEIDLGGKWSGENWFRWDFIWVWIDLDGKKSGGNRLGLELIGSEVIGLDWIRIRIDRVGNVSILNIYKFFLKLNCMLKICFFI